MTEPPRPPDDDPTAPYNAPGGYPPPPPPYTPPPSYTPPTTSGAGGYPPPYGAPYGQQPYGPPQYGPPVSADERTWIIIAHFGGAAAAFFGGVFLGWIPPLVAFLARGNVSPAVRAESVKALNFQLVWTIVGVIGYVLIACAGLGLLVTGAAWLIATIFGVIAGVKALNNEPYNYPMTYRFIK